MPATAIKKWTPRHDRVALLYAAGYKNTEVAEVVGMTSGTVGAILRDPRAVRIREEFIEELREKLFQSYEDQVLDLVEYALKNLGRTLRVHVDPEKLAAKAHQDKVSVEVMKMAGFGLVDRRSTGGIQMTREEVAMLKDAIANSDKAREIHGGSYEVLSDGPNGKEATD